MSSAYSDIFIAVTSGKAVSAETAAQMLARLREDDAHELAERQRAYAETEYRIEASDSYAAQRIKRRKKGATYDAAALIDPASPDQHTPTNVSEVENRTEVVPTSVDGSPAAQLAEQIERQPDVEHLEVLDASRVRVHVRPQSLDTWRWWLARFDVPVDTLTSKGAYMTAKGERQGVTVLLAGLGVPALFAAARSGGGS